MKSLRYLPIPLPINLPPILITTLTIPLLTIILIPPLITPTILINLPILLAAFDPIWVLLFPVQAIHRGKYFNRQLFPISLIVLQLIPAL